MGQDPVEPNLPVDLVSHPHPRTRDEHTSLSLLEHLQRASESAWDRFHHLYHPYIRYWIGRVPGLREEQDDVCQEVLAAVFQLLPAFDRHRNGSFRKWLREITSRRIRECVRKRRKLPLAGAGPDETEHFLARLEDPRSDLTAEWDAEHRRLVLERVYAVVRRDFEPRTWDMFRAVVLDEREVDAVAAEFGVTAGAVLRSNARVLRRLRQEAGDLID